MVSVLDLWHQALVTAATVAAPFVLAALAVGVLTSLLQTAIQLQENILSFVPKILAVALVLTLSGHWVLSRLIQHTHTTMSSIVQVAQEGR